MTTSKYLQHEDQYRQLLNNGFQGWGGEKFDERIKNWKSTVESLLGCESFPAATSRVLELGSGTGDGLIPFVEKGYEVSGVEISPTAVNWANEKFARLGLNSKFVEGNIAEKIPFADASFDVVLDGACLHCILDEDRKVVFQEIKRVLKPGGFLLVSHMVNDPRELGPGLSFNQILRTQERMGEAYRFMPKEEQLLGELNGFGFKVIQKTIRRNTWWDHAELWCLNSTQK
jgi:ubiquinone/menaquinone biosynthesis C-methylase UbiE